MSLFSIVMPLPISRLWPWPVWILRGFSAVGFYLSLNFRVRNRENLLHRVLKPLERFRPFDHFRFALHNFSQTGLWKNFQYTRRLCAHYIPLKSPEWGAGLQLVAHRSPIPEMPVRLWRAPPRPFDPPDLSASGMLVTSLKFMPRKGGAVLCTASCRRCGFLSFALRNSQSSLS